MKHKSLKKMIGAALAALALSMSTVSAAVPDTEAQLDIIAAAQKEWRADFAAFGTLPIVPPWVGRFTPSETHFAVTDLDANGRLELLVRHATCLTEPGHDAFRRLPTAVGMSVYEIDEEGKLDHIAIDTTEEAPDLMRLGGVHEITADGTRRYHLTRLLISKDDAYKYHLSYIQFDLSNGKVHRTRLAESHGVYAVYSEGMPEALPGTSAIHDGDPAHANMSDAEFDRTDLIKNFQRFHLDASFLPALRRKILHRAPLCVRFSALFGRKNLRQPDGLHFISDS